MAIKRDSLRAQRDFYSPMTGNTGTEIRYAAAPTQTKSTYGSQVKEKLSDIGQNTRRSAPIIKAIKTAMKKTDDPFTQIAEKKSYAPQEENDIGAQIQGVAGAAQDAIGEGVAQVEEVVRSTGQRASKRRAEQAEKRARERAADKAETDKKFASFGQAYRSDLSSFADKTGARFSDYEKSLKSLRTDFTGSKADQARAMKEFKAGIRSDVALGDKNLADKLSAYSKELSGKIDYTGQRVSDVEGKIGEQQKQVSSIDQRLGTTYGGVVGLKESLAAIKAKQDARTAPKQVSNLPSNYKSTEAEAFRAAEAFKEAKGIAARNPNVKVGVDSKGKPVATAVQRTRDEAGARTAAANAARVKANAQARAQTAAVNRKLQGKTVSQVKSENKQSMQDAARKRNEAFKKAKAQKSGRGFGGSATQGKNAPSKPKAGSFGISAAGRKKAAANRAAAKKKASAAKKKAAKKKSSSKAGSKSSSRGARGGTSSRSRGGAGGKGGSKGGSKSSSRGARGGSSSRSRGGTSRGGRRGRTGRGGRRGGRRCDIRCKVNISLLTNMNLLRDDLADVAYFVRELREVEL